MPLAPLRRIWLSANFDDAGGAQHLFARVLDVEGKPVKTDNLIIGWSEEQIFACRPTTSLAKVAQTMSEQNVGAVVVVDKDGHLQGVLSSTDLVRARNTNGHYDNLPNLAPEQIMTRNVITVTANEPLSAAINKLIENRIDRLVVVQRENGHQTPVGMLSMADLARLAV